MKRAFTMIELIFVIVIIGILASVAIPKMMASRDDAKVSTELNNLAVYITDLTTYYMATGNASSNHTNVKLHCFSSNVTVSNTTLRLSVSSGGNDDGEKYCTKAQSTATRKGLIGVNVITFGGHLVSY